MNMKTYIRISRGKKKNFTLKDRKYDRQIYKNFPQKIFKYIHISYIQL